VVIAAMNSSSFGIGVPSRHRFQGRGLSDTPSRRAGRTFGDSGRRATDLSGTGALGARGPALPLRLKKLIGTVVLVALVIVYALVATTVAAARLGESSPLVHLAFFFFTGILWIVPAMGIIKWLMLPPRPKG
jgi:hypothetical protein